MVSAFGLLSLFVFVAIAVVAAALTLAFVRRRRVTRPSCGRCGYAVAGLEALRCPECGADLREVGIAVPDRRGRRAPLAVVLAMVATMVLLFSYGFTLRLAVMAGRVVVSNTSIRLQRPDGPWRSISAGRDVVDGVPGAWTVEVTPPGSIAARALGLEVGDPEHVRAQTLERWLGTTVEDPEAAEATRVAGELATVLGRFEARDVVDTSGTGFVGAQAARSMQTTQRPMQTLGVVLVGLHVAAWVVVLLLLVRWVRRGAKQDATAATDAAKA